MKKNKKISSDFVSSKFGIFGLPVTRNEARLVLLPVPWEVTTSYGKGASLGPKIIREASEQVDLFDFETKTAFEAGYFMEDISNAWMQKNKRFKSIAQKVIKMKGQMSGNKALERKLLAQVNKACGLMSDWVYEQTKDILSEGKLFGLVGGDHSTPLGAIRAISEHHSGNFGILHIDAHADLREAYLGFEQSHASIMFNVMNSKFAPKKLVQVGIRDFCQEEFELSEGRKDIKTFFDLPTKRRLLEGDSWAKIVADILAELPEKIYVSFDIDGLDPALCPHTGTPVPGGLSLDQVFYLLSQLSASGKKIIGFDLNEVSPGGEASSEWDGNVGARVLYKLCGWSVLTNTP